MLTTVDLPDALYSQVEELASARGATVEQLIVESVAGLVAAGEGLTGKDSPLSEFEDVDARR
jgi:predicted transcriptional regulator